MAVSFGSSGLRRLDLGNPRFCRLYEGCINNLEKRHVVSSNRGSLESYFLEMGNEVLDKAIDNLLKIKESMLLPEQDFSWLKNDRSACSYVWLSLEWLALRQVSHYSGGLFGVMLKSPDELSCFQDVLTGWNGSSVGNHYEDVVSFFDLWNAPIAEKKSSMANLHRSWSNAYSKRVNFSWVCKEDEEQCHWVWRYLNKHLNICASLHPENADEEYHCSRSVLNFWRPVDSEKELFIMKLKKAWSQKVYRNKQVGKTPLNTYISPEAKEKLKWMARARGEKMMETLEMVIKEAYDREV